MILTRAVSFGSQLLHVMQMYADGICLRSDLVARATISRNLVTLRWPTATCRSCCKSFLPYGFPICDLNDAKQLESTFRLRETSSISSCSCFYKVKRRNEETGVPEGPVMSQVAGPWIRRSFRWQWRKTRRHVGIRGTRVADPWGKTTRLMADRTCDSGSRCLGSGFSDSSPGDSCSVQDGTGSSPAEGSPRRLSLSFANESKARCCSPAPLISWSSDRVVTLRILRTPSVSLRLINFTSP